MIDRLILTFALATTAFTAEAATFSGSTSAVAFQGELSLDVPTKESQQGIALLALESPLGFNVQVDQFAVDGNGDFMPINLFNETTANFQVSGETLTLVFPSQASATVVFGEIIADLFDGSLSGVDATITVRTAEPNVIPLPAALPMSLAALAALGAVGYRRRGALA